MVKFPKGARGKGIKPVIGADCWITQDTDRDKPYRVLLICKNRKGYGQLCELLTRAYMENKYRGRAEIRRDWLTVETASDLLCLSGAKDGDIGQALANGNVRLAEQLAADWAQRFPGGFYIEIQAPALGTEATSAKPGDRGQVICRWWPPTRSSSPGRRTSRPTRPGSASPRAMCCPTSAGRGLHRAAVFQDPGRDVRLFADIPEALENSVEIARRCNLTLQLGKNFLPLFPTPEGMTLDDFLPRPRGLEERLKSSTRNEEEREPSARATRSGSSSRPTPSSRWASPATS
jgi:DNA polymerase-3 subunit alpha